MSARKEEKISPEKIEEFLNDQEKKGRKASSLQNYRRILQDLYRYLPEDKCIREQTGSEWKTYVERQGLQPATVNTRISVWNSFLRYLGRREWQMADFEREVVKVQPKLSRTEYLRLLSAAKQLDKEKTYLLIKTLGGAGMRIQELPQLTVEAVTAGKVELEASDPGRRRVVHLPAGLREELLDYTRREGIRCGPVFGTSEGVPMARSNVNYFVGLVSRDARVDEQKVTPSCLWKMYRETCEEIQAKVAVLIEQTYQNMLEEEQRATGWKV